MLSLSIDDVIKQLRIYHIEFSPLSHQYRNYIFVILVTDISKLLKVLTFLLYYYKLNITHFKQIINNLIV
jgi:hypothetical protein